MVFRNTGIAYLLRGAQCWAISAVTLVEQGGVLYLNLQVQTLMYVLF